MKKKKNIIISVIILLLIVIGILVWLFLFKDKKTEPKTFVVTFNTDNGTLIAPIKLECDKSLKLPENPTKEGYEFKYWTDKNGTAIYNDALLTCEDITLYAAWEEIKEEKTTFQVSFVSDGGIKVDPITVKCGETLKLPKKPTREGYTFKAWYDKYGTSILDGALLACEDVTLKAAWEEVIKEKKYTCPSGYELVDTNKCVEKKDWIKKCKDGWKEVNGECVNPSSPNPKGTRVCPSKTYSGWTGTGTYYEAGAGYCGYQELTSYIGQRDNCRNNGGTLAANNHCYKYTVINGYTIECASGEKKFAAQEIAPGNGGGCYQVMQKEITCESGYTMNYTYNKCVKVIDATLE